MRLRSRLHSRDEFVIRDDDPDASAPASPGDRRRLLKMLGATAVGAVGASLVEASPAGAADGDPVIMGVTNTCTSTTFVEPTEGTAIQGTTASNGVTALLGFDSSPTGGIGTGGQSDNGTGIYGIANNFSGLLTTGEVAGVIGDSDTVQGVVGLSSLSNGVSGVTSGSNQAGVFGFDSSVGDTSFGVAGVSDTGCGVFARGVLAPLYLSPSGFAGAPTTGAHSPGQMYVDQNGVFYKCVVAGTPGTWVPMYSVVPLLTPVRVISTPSGATNTGGLVGPFSPNGATHVTSVLTGGATGIPDIAVGVVANLTISANGGTLNGDGYLTLFPGGTSNPGTSSLNSGGDAFATSNGVTVSFGTGPNAGTLSFSWQGGGSPPACQVFLDVTAYIL